MNTEKNYPDGKFWDKLKRTGKKAGTSTVYTALLLYYTLKKPDIPVKAKTIIIGALGYFILPLDLIPDVAIGIGYTDDITLLISALITVSMYIDNKVKCQAKEKLADWFGESADTTNIDEKLVRG